MTLRFLTCAKLTTLTCRAAVPVRDFWLCAVQSLFLTDQVIPKWGSFDYGLTYACAIPEQTNRICFKASWASSCGQPACSSSSGARVPSCMPVVATSVQDSEGNK